MVGGEAGASPVRSDSGTVGASSAQTASVRLAARAAASGKDPKPKTRIKTPDSRRAGAGQAATRLDLAGKHGRKTMIRKKWNGDELVLSVETEDEFWKAVSTPGEEPGRSQSAAGQSAPGGRRGRRASVRAQVHVGRHRLGTGGQAERCANRPRGGRVRENRLGGPRTGPLRLGSGAAPRSGRGCPRACAGGALRS